MSEKGLYIIYFYVMLHYFCYIHFWMALINKQVLEWTTWRLLYIFDYAWRSLREEEKFKMKEWIKKEWISLSNKWQASQELYPGGWRINGKQAKSLYEKYFGKRNSEKSEYQFEGQWISLALFKALFENNYKFWELFVKSKIKKGWCKL